MAADFDCPCGVTVRIPDALVGRKVKCPHCGQPIPTAARGAARSTFVPSDETFDPEGDAPRSSVGVAVILMGVIVPLLIAAGFGWYVYSSGEQSRFEASLRRTHADAVRLEAGQPEVAYRKFMAIVAAAASREVVGAEARRAVADARDGAVRVFPAARIAFQRRQAEGASKSASAEQFLDALLRIALVLAAIAVVLAPLFLPAILSRRGVLDVARWLSMAAFFFFLAGLFSAPWFFIGGRGLVIVTGSGFFSAWLMEWVPGCCLAAALSRPR